jgi:hypothetical protein
MAKLVKGALYDGATIEHVAPLAGGRRRMYLSDGRSLVLGAPKSRPVTGGRHGEQFPAGIGSGSFGQANRIRAHHGKWRGERDGRPGDRTTVRIAAWNG